MNKKQWTAGDATHLGRAMFALGSIFKMMVVRQQSSGCYVTINKRVCSFCV